MGLRDVQWAPLSVPKERRLQTLSIFILENVVPISCFLTFITFFSLAMPLVIAYFIWIWWDQAPFKGGRLIPSVRKLKFWKHGAEYFPLTLKVEEPLDAKNKYLFGSHPHGLISIGTFFNFATDVTGFQEKLPGINLRLGTVTANFRLPYWREVLLSLGVVDVSRQSLTYVLDNLGLSVMIVVGGAMEALDAQPGTNALYLQRRKGFIKLALQTGAHLVPVYSFGENDLWKQAPNPPGSRLRRAQEFAIRVMGFFIPAFYGRGLFNYSFGFMPYRRPVITVVGKPIPVEKKENPTAEEIDALHQTYIAGIKALWDRHKQAYAVNRTKSLAIVG